MRVGMGNSYSVVTDACDPGIYNIGQYIDYRDFSITLANPCTEPSTQASNIGFNTITASTVNLTFDRGNGSGGVLVVARQGSAVNIDPNSGTTYTANTIFGSGAQIGTGNYVVYNSNVPASGAVTVPITGLTVNQTYYFAIYEYNSVSTCYNLNELTGNVLIIPPCAGTPAISTANPSPSSLCASGTSNLSLTGLAINSGYTYQWYSSNTSNTGPWSLIGAATSSTYTTPTINTTMWYYCEVTCSNGGASQNSTVAEVTVVPNNLTATINGVPGPVNVCSGATVNLSASGTSTYSWTSVPPGFTSSLATTSATPLVNTVYNIAGTISGCTFNTSVTANIFSVAVSPATSTINLGSSVALTATPSNGTGTISYLWSPCNTLSSGTTASTTTTPTAATPYIITVFDMNGCSASATATVNVLDPSIPPTAPTTIVSGYSLTSTTNPVYNAASGLTNLATGSGVGGTMDDNIFTSIPIGFSFVYNGISYNSIGISTNGFVWFGTGTASATNYTPISSASANLGGSGVIDGVIAVFGSDIYGGASSGQRLSYGNPTGSTFMVEWNGVKGTGSGSNNINRCDLQLVLTQSTNTIDIRVNDYQYGFLGSYSGQIGLRGLNNTDYRNIKADCSGGNTWLSPGTSGPNTAVASQSAGSGCYAGSISGRCVQYRFSPSCSATQTVVSASGSTNLCPSGSVNLTASVGTSYQWYLNGAAIPGPTGTNQTITGVNTAGNYVAATTVAGCSIPSYITAVTTNVNVNPTVSITSNPSPICNATTATFTATPIDAGCAAVYQWKLNGAQVGTNSTTYTNTSLVDGDQVQVIMQTNAYCSASNTANSNTIIKQPCFPVWVGGTVGFETDWNTPTNWSGNTVPTLSDSAVIPVRPFLPFISLGVNAVAKYVTLETDGTLLIDASKSLSIAINGQFINNSGAINNLGSGKVIFNGTGTITGTNATQFGDLELNASTTLTTIPTIAGSLILNNGASLTSSLNYTNTSTLIYNQGGSVNAGNEWTGNSNLAGNGIPNHITIQNASILTLPSSNRGLAGNMTIVNGTLVLNATAGNLFIGGNWLRNATNGILQSNNRRIIFNGAANQTIEVNTPSGNEVFYQLEMNKSTGNLQIVTGTNLTVQNELILVDGKFDLNSNQLTLGTSGNNGTLTGGGANNYIISQNGSSQFIRYATTAAPTTYLFPLGDATGYTPISVTMNNATSVNSDTRLQSSMTTAAHPVIGSSTDYLSRYWTVEPIGLVGTPLYGVEYIYKDADVIGVEADLKPYKYGTTTGWLAALGSGAQYEQGTGTVNPGTNTINWTGLSSFSDFTGNGSGSPLPINLLRFIATPLVEAVELTWTTATETNNDYFTIERASDAIHFESIHIEDGAGNSNQILNYGWIDTNPFDGDNYYRLKQTDFDGSFTYSMVRVVNFNKPVNSSNNWVNVFPNPITNGIVYLNFGEIESDKVVISLYTLTGQVVWQQEIAAVSNKTSEVKFDGLSLGLYYIQIQNGNMIENKKIFIK
jgi:hypothetical protein